MATKHYDDNAVFIPGTGAVLIAPVDTDAPTADELSEWVKAGAIGNIGKFMPLGYTSEDELPSFETDTDGGERKGAWENSSLRMTPTKTTESVSVTPIQWTEEPLTHRFGPGTIEKTKGHFVMPKVYTSTKVALLVVIRDGSSAIGIHYFKTETAPNDSLELDPEKFAGLPVKYSVLVSTEKGKGTIIAAHLKGESSASPAVSGGGA